MEASGPQRRKRTKRKSQRDEILDTVAFHLRTQLGYTPKQTAAALKAAELTYDLVAELARQALREDRRKRAAGAG